MKTLVKSLIVVLAALVTSCAAPPPKPDKVVRIDVYHHAGPLGPIMEVLKLIPIP